MAGFYECINTTVNDIVEEHGNHYDTYALCAYGVYDYTIDPRAEDNYALFYLGSFGVYKNSLKDEEVFFIDEESKEICLVKNIEDLNLTIIWDGSFYDD